MSGAAGLPDCRSVVGSALLAEQLVAEAVDEAAVFEAGLAPDAATAKPRLLKHAHRGPVAGIDVGLDPHGVGPAETVGDGRLQRLCHDAPAPQVLGQPVARFGAEAFDVAARREGDASPSTSMQ